MEQLSQKLLDMEKEVSSQKGSFRLFGLFLREDSENKWDLVVSASWIDEDKENALQYLTNQLQQRLGKEELLRISRTVIIDKDNPFLEHLKPAFKIKHSSVKMENVHIDGLTIKEAWVFACQ